MVRHATGVARAGIGAEGFLAGMDRVAGEKKGYPQNPHHRVRSRMRAVIRNKTETGLGRKHPAWRHIDMVDEVPLAIVFDRPEATAVQVHVQRQQGGLQKTEDGVVGRVVEVSPGDDSVDADSRERIRQEPRR